jgi:hypothetical protein
MPGIFFAHPLAEGTLKGFLLTFGKRGVMVA